VYECVFTFETRAILAFICDCVPMCSVTVCNCLCVILSPTYIHDSNTPVRDCVQSLVCVIVSPPCLYGLHMDVCDRV
jgi:hypothetical protein